ncbi:YozE family protein [Oceanobacillus halotolerans]|uniref:YozE family protein n=1 Tax=Oceanobacillus halotolerans TaxID=2663380 RepID=UPI0013D9A33E|nr:YozE family protein [Oceanobacillus halotolerans]
MRSFYHYVMTYRGKKNPDEKSKLADWIFHDHNFPKHSTSYHEISDYLEWNSPFPSALMIFDEIWNHYSSE